VEASSPTAVVSHVVSLGSVCGTSQFIERPRPAQIRGAVRLFSHPKRVPLRRRRFPPFFWNGTGRKQSDIKSVCQEREIGICTLFDSPSLSLSCRGIFFGPTLMEEERENIPKTCAVDLSCAIYHNTLGAVSAFLIHLHKTNSNTGAALFLLQIHTC